MMSDTPSNMGGLDALITPLWNTGVVPSSSLWVTWAYSLVDFKANPNQNPKQGGAVELSTLENPTQKQ